MKRYSALLLFQFRADLGNDKSDIMRRCEYRIITVPARNAESALNKAMVHGEKSEFDGQAEAGNPLLFEFIGVVELLEMDAYDPEEVWFDLRTLKLPMERRDKLIPPKNKLTAIFWERKRKKKTPTTQSSRAKKQPHGR